MIQELLAVDTWKYQQLFGLMFCILMIGLNVYRCNKGTELSLLVAVVFFSIHGVFVGQMTSVLILLSFYLIFLFFKFTEIMTVFSVITGIMVLDMFWIYFHRFGFLNAYTFDLAVAICLVPLLLIGNPTIFRWIVSLLFIITAAHFNARTAAIAFVAAIIGYLFASKRRGESYLLFICFVISLYITREQTIHDPRLTMWSTYFDWWNENANHYIGTGFGSFDLLGPFIKVNDQSYKFMHNDLLQILFETGFIGLSIVFWVMARILVVSYRQPVLLSFWLSYFVTCFFYFPTHYFLSQLLAVMMLIVTFRSRIETAH